MWSHHRYSLNSLFTLSPSTSTPWTLYPFYSPLFCFWYLSIFKGVSQCIPTVNTLYFDQFNTSITLPSPCLSPSIFRQLSIHILIYSTFKDVTFYDIVDALSFSSSFPPSQSSIVEFYYYKHVLHIRLHMVMFGFVYMFIFCIYIPHMRENTQPLSSWTWLHLTLCPSLASIYLQSTLCHFAYGCVKLHVNIYIYKGYFSFTFCWEKFSIYTIFESFDIIEMPSTIMFLSYITSSGGSNAMYNPERLWGKYYILFQKLLVIRRTRQN
jgi:hypothetical protein